MNDSGATISNDGSAFFNAGALTNHGTVNSFYDVALLGSSYFGNEGTLTNASNGVIYNTDSNFYNGDLNTSATLVNAGVINNTGYFENDATLANALGGAINNTGAFENYAALTNTSGGAVNNLAGASFYNDGTLSNALGGVITNDDSTFYNSDFVSGATLTNSGTFNNQDSASFYNYSATVSNTAGATLTNDDSGFYNYGTVTNNGVINNQNNAYFYNDATLLNNSVGAAFTNDATSEIDNEDDFFNYGTLTNAGYLYNGWYLYNYGSGSLVNSGTLYNDFYVENDGNLVNNGTFDNEYETYNGGTLTNNGSLNNQDYGYFENYSGATLNNAGVLNNGDGAFYGETSDFNEEFDNYGTLNNLAGGVINNDYAYLYNDGTLTNSGIINNQDDSYFYNEGTVVNEGILNNDGGSTLENDDYFSNSGTLNNSGELDNYDNFYNSGTLTNGGYLYNDWYFENDANLVNYGTIDNVDDWDGFYNYGTLTNWGTIDNQDYAYFENDGTLNNAGLITNGDGSTYNEFDNYGVLNNEASGVINNNDGYFYNYGGTLTNKGVINIGNDSYFENDATLNNFGQINNGDGSTYNEFDNYGTLNNNAGGVINNNYDAYFYNFGTLTNNGYFNNQNSNLYNQFGGTFTNNGGLAGGSVYNEIGSTFVNAGSANINYFYQDSTSKLVIVVTPRGADTLNVSGGANVAGTLQVVYAPGAYGNRSYTLLNAAGGVSGSFSNLAAPATYADASGLTYDDASRHVDLAVVGMEVSPSDDGIFSDLRDSLVQGAQDSNAGTLQRLDGLSGGLGVDLVDAGGNTQTGAWEKNTGSLMQVAAGGSQPGYQAKSGIVSAGMDQRWGDTVAGFSVGDGQTQVSVSDGEVGTVETPGLGLYGGLTLGPVLVDASAAYAYDSFTSSRPVASVGQTASTAYNGQQASGAVQVGAPMGFGGVDFLPVVGAGYAWLGTDRFTENGSPYFDLNGATLNQSSLRPFAGLTAEKGFHVGAFSVSPDLKVGYSYETLTQEQGTAALNGSEFGLNGEAPTRGELSAGGGFASKLTDRVSFIGSYSIVVPTGTLMEQTLSLGARASF